MYSCISAFTMGCALEVLWQDLSASNQNVWEKWGRESLKEFGTSNACSSLVTPYGILLYWTPWLAIYFELDWIIIELLFLPLHFGLLFKYFIFCFGFLHFLSIFKIFVGEISPTLYFCCVLFVCPGYLADGLRYQSGSDGALVPYFRVGSLD